MKPDQLFFDAVDTDGDCWEWQLYVHPAGYGMLTRRGKRHYAHRYVWEMMVGPIPEGYDIDHLCRNKACVNPDHLEPVTRKENLRRGVTRQGKPSKIKGFRYEMCRRGKGPHRMEDPNLYYNHRGGRQCKACVLDKLQKVAFDTGGGGTPGPHTHPATTTIGAGS